MDLEYVPEPVEVSTCTICTGTIGYQDCPTGGWWVHFNHPEDGHDAESPYEPEIEEW